MKNLIVFTLLLFIANLWGAAKPLPVLPAHKGAALDFDFKGVGGKKEFSDRTGKYKLYSDTEPMLEEEGALRVADSARLHIPCKDDAFGEKVTINMWFLNTASTWQWHLPLLERGIQDERHQAVVPLMRSKGPYDFTLYFTQKYPGFVTGRTGTDAVGTEGIVAYGSRYSKSSYYYNRNFKTNPVKEHISPDKAVRTNYWQLITAVYDNGATKIYLDGKLVVEAPAKRKEKFLTSGQDLVIGAFRYDGDLNKNTAEILVKSLTITPKVMSDKEIADLYAAESKLMDSNRKRGNLKITQYYYSPERKAMDPGLKRTLKISAEYMKKLPADPYKGKKNMTARFDKNGMLEINGKKYPPVMVNMYHYDRALPRRKIVLTDFAAGGLDTAAFDIRQFWLGEGKYNWKVLDDLLKTYVEACPTVKITVVLGLNPEQWFMQKYPEEMEKHMLNPYSKNPKKVTYLARAGVLGSDKFKSFSEELLTAVVRHCESSPYANHIYGYQIFGGAAGEWYWPGLFANSGNTGYSEPTRQGLITYLRKKYKNDVSLLRQAWNNKTLTFESVEMPSPGHRRGAENGIFRDRKAAQDVIDSREYLNDRTKQCFLDVGRIIRKNAPNKIIGIYNGYVVLYSSLSVMPFSGLQTLSDAFYSPDIDLIATPVDYAKRRYKQPGVNINGFNGTAMLYGKSIWREEDSSTHLNPGSNNSRAGTLRETLEVKRRAFGYTMAGSYGFWYCFQMPLYGFHQDEIAEDTAKMKKIADASVYRSRQSVADVAVIFDEKESLYYSTPARFSGFIKSSLWNVYHDLHTAGIPFDMYFTTDLSHPKMKDYKMYIFLNQWSVNEKTLKVIKEKLARNNALAVWQYAPGYMDDGRVDLKNMEKLTGMRFAEKRKKTDFIPEKIAYLPSKLTNKVKQPDKLTVSPVFSVQPSSGVKVLSTANGMNIMAEKGRNLWTLLPLTPELIRNLCRSEKIHVYSDNGNTLLVNASYLMVHTHNDKPFTVQLPGVFKVTETIRNKKFGKVRAISEKLPAGTTAIYLLEK